MNKPEKIRELMMQKKELEKKIRELREDVIKEGNVRLKISNYENAAYYTLSVFIESKNHWTNIRYSKSADETIAAITDIISDLGRVLGNLQGNKD